MTRTKLICDNCDDAGPCETWVDNDDPLAPAPRCVFHGNGHWRRADTPSCAIPGDAAPDNPPCYTPEDGPEHWDVCYALHGAPGCLAHVLKYAWRCGKKPGVPMATDLRKLKNWVEFLLRKEGAK